MVSECLRVGGPVSVGRGDRGLFNAVGNRDGKRGEAGVQFDISQPKCGRCCYYSNSLVTSWVAH